MYNEVIHIIKVHPLDLIFLAIKYNPPATKDVSEKRFTIACPRAKTIVQIGGLQGEGNPWVACCPQGCRGGGGCGGFAGVPDAESTRKLAMIFDEQIRAGNPERQRGLAPFLKMVPPKGERDRQPEKGERGWFGRVKCAPTDVGCFIPRWISYCARSVPIIVARKRKIEGHHARGESVVPSSASIKGRE